MGKLLVWLRRMSTSVVPVIIMAIFMLGSLWLLSAATENSGQFGRMHVTLVVVNVLGLIVLVGLIGIDVVRLVRQYRRAATGSRLTVRLVIIFVVMALVPVSIVFYFSLGFLQKGIDSWFDVRLERAMEDSLELSRSSLDMRMRDRLKQTRAIAVELQETPNAIVMFRLNELRDESGASELTLLFQSGRVIASSSADTMTIIPQKPGGSILSQVRDKHDYVGLAPIDNMGLHIRAAVQIDTSSAAVDPRILFMLYPIDARVSVLADGVQLAITQYKELVYLRNPLKQSFSFTLALVLLVTLLSAVWAAFFFAQRLVAPIRILAIGTRAVASGNYQKKLPITRTTDELGALVQSFMDMTNKVSEAQRDAQKSQHRAEREQNYLRAVLGRLSSGVITLDKNQRMRAVNAAANHILEQDMDSAMGKSLEQIEHDAPELKTFIAAIAKHIDDDVDDWREEITLTGFGRHKTLMCQGARLPGVKGMTSGFVVVFDDVTAMIQAQRDAAWGEVARRLAHEIKNPLTPIQLSAERLRHKYLGKMAPEDAEVLDRSTHTIVQQVQSMKDMVEAFSEYARAPKLQPLPLVLAVLIGEVLDLYAGEKQAINLFVHGKKESTPMVEADVGRIRQLLHNLIRNAIESLSDTPQGKVDIHLQEVEHASEHVVEIKIEDNGPGIPPDMLENLFEPYVTNKPKGSGLGLAVVKRIVEEHNGLLYAENRTEGGARIVIRLPALKIDMTPLAETQRTQNSGR
ncbi:MAG: ATP-binding protein [Gammaproteobacteria bacterium]|nr:ATP-binding protein [Gammaproteobacteria bacterium]MCF6259799.1 ATP-binding protein [Gammaproteobacteria bacterium]